MDHPRYHGRTVEWGHWGITFMEVQPDLSKNFGSIVGTIGFPVANGCGPQDLLGRKSYQEACRAWVEEARLPEGIIR